MRESHSRRLADIAPQLENVLAYNDENLTLRFTDSDIRRETVWVTMRDGIRLATDLYLPPERFLPAVAARTPYGRASPKLAGALLSIARHGYIAISQDCRGTGDSEPDSWDYYVHEREDGIDFVDWVVRQEWFNGFLGSCGGSYLGATQWCMAMHPRMSAIAPEVCGLGFGPRTTRCHMFLNAYARSVGKGSDKVPIPYEQLEGQILSETLAGGFFNEPVEQPHPAALLELFPRLRELSISQGKRWLWEHYSRLDSKRCGELIKLVTGKDNVTITDVEGLTSVFGHQVPHDAHLLPRVRDTEILESLHAPALMITGWYDWFLDDALATWDRLQKQAVPSVGSRSRLLITPSAHLMPGYREGRERHPELDRVYRTQNLAGLLLSWYSSIREDALARWPKVIYYLMGANQWNVASAWPPPDAQTRFLYLAPEGLLSSELPAQDSTPTRYTYDPQNPTLTVGGSIISYVYPTGSVDVSEVQRQPDVVCFTTEALEEDWDVVGPLRLILYFSSSACDTDVSARLSDVFPDGRAIQLQSGILRLRYRNTNSDPQLLEPGRIYRLQIDLWATANRFKGGHRLRLDISSADFPRFDRNANRGGEEGPPLRALQTIYHDAQHPSHLLIPVIGAVHSQA